MTDNYFTREQFISVLGKYHFKLEEQESSIRLFKQKASNPAIRIQSILSLAIIVVWFLWFLFIKMETGLLIMAGSAPFLINVFNLKQKIKKAENSTIEITQNKIELRTGYKSKRILLTEIDKIELKVNLDKNAAIGIVFLILNNKSVFELIEVIGKEESAVNKDITILAEYLSEHYLFHME